MNEKAGLKSLLPWLLVCLLLSAPISCGKKEAPRLPVHEKPPAPSALGAVHREGEIILRWQYPEDRLQAIEGFVVMRAEDGKPEKIAFTRERAYADWSFAPGKSYRYTVLARDLRGTRSEPSEEVRVSPGRVPPPPEGLSFEILKDSVRLSWSYTGEEGALFNLYRSGEQGAYSLDPVNPEPIEGFSFEDGIDAKEMVYYTVRALRGGSLRDEGPPSEEVAIGPGDYLPSGPTGLHAVLLEEGVALLWQENPEAWVKGYRVYRAKEGGGFVAIGESVTPTFTDREGQKGKALYKVSAVGPEREGPPSEPVEVIPH